MKDQENDNTQRNGSVGDVENRPTCDMETKKIYVEEVDVDKVHDLPVEQRCLAEDYAVEDPIDQVADGAPKDHRKRKADDKRLIFDPEQIDEDAHTRKEGEDGEKEFSPEVDPEGHPRIFDERQPHKIAEHRRAASKRNAGVVEIQKRNRETFDKEFCYLVKDNNRPGDVENAHGLQTDRSGESTGYFPLFSLHSTHN